MKRRTLLALLLAAPLASAAGSLRIVTDERIELMSVVQYLADYRYPPVPQLDTEWRRAVVAHFERFRGHRAVQLCRERSPRGFGYDAMPAVMLAASPLPELRLVREIEPDVVKRAGGKRKIAEWLDALREFAAESGFLEFYAQHRPQLEHPIAETAALLKDRDPVKDLEEYFRTRQSSYTVVLGMLVHNGGFGLRYPTPAGNLDIYSIVGPNRAEGGQPRFFFAEGLEYLVWHEFAHSFVNPEIDRRRKLFDSSRGLYAAIAEKMQSQAYHDWQTAVGEHLVRAVTIRLTARVHGDPVARARLAMERARGFAYVEPLAESLKNFEADPVKYPAFRDYLPELARVLDNLAERRP